MAEPHLTHDQEMHTESHAPYIKIFLILLVFTIMEYFYAMLMQRSFGLLVIGLMTMAITKAALVGMYFMHLKFEGRWVYVMLIPAGILATVFILALYPDVAMQPVTEENPIDADEQVSAPADPGPGRFSVLTRSPREHRPESGRTLVPTLRAMHYSDHILRVAPVARNRGREATRGHGLGHSRPGHRPEWMSA